MKSIASIGLALLVSFCGCRKKESATPATNAPSAGGNPLNAPMDYLGGVAQGKKLAEKTVDLATLNRAILLFHEQEDRYPKDLNELVSMRFLPAIPKAPYGMKITYNAANGEVKIIKQ